MKPASKEVATTISKAISEIHRGINKARKESKENGIELKGEKLEKLSDRKVNSVCKKYDLTPSWINLIIGR